VAGEAQAGTLRYLLVRPVGRTKLLVAKLVAVLAFTMTAVTAVAPTVAVAAAATVEAVAAANELGRRSRGGGANSSHRHVTNEMVRALTEQTTAIREERREFVAEMRAQRGASFRILDRPRWRRRTRRSVGLEACRIDAPAEWRIRPAARN